MEHVSRRMNVELNVLLGAEDTIRRLDLNERLAPNFDRKTAGRAFLFSQYENKWPRRDASEDVREIEVCSQSGKDHALATGICQPLYKKRNTRI